MKKIVGVIVCLALVGTVIMLAFGWERSPDIELREVVSQTISAAEGGTITVTEEDSFSLAGLQLHIPPGALDSDQQITIAEIVDGLRPHSEDHVSLGRQMSLRPAGLSFATPATLQIIFSDEEWLVWSSVVAAEDILVVRLDESSGNWVAVPSQVHEGILTAEIGSFSDWDVVVPRRAISIKDVEKDIRRQATQWGVPESQTVDERLTSTSVFVDHSRPPVYPSVYALDMTFADAIGALLLAEDMCDMISAKNFQAMAILAETSLRDMAKRRLTDLALSRALDSLGMSSAMSFVGVGGSIVSAIEYFRKSVIRRVFNDQVMAYLSWRGWFYEDNEEKGKGWIYLPNRANSHQDVLNEAWILKSDNGWLMCYQVRTGEGCFGYRGSNVPGESPERLYSLGNMICDILHKYSENNWVPASQYPKELKAERKWLEEAFKGNNEAPTVTIEPPASSQVGQMVSLEAKVRDKEGDPVVWRWRQTGGPYVRVDHWRLSPSFTPTAHGTYAFELTAWDLLVENQNSASVVISVKGEETVEYDLTISSLIGGSVTVTVDGQATVVGAGQTESIADIPAGTVINLAASPASGYQFVNWVGAPLDGSSNPVTTITMNGNYSITANFEEIPATQYELTVSSGTGGSVTVTVNTQQTTVGQGQTQTVADIPAGTGINLAASPASGYQFVNWVGVPIDGSSNPVTTITMNGNYSITASFEEIPATQYELTISSTAGGSVTTPGEGTSTHNAGATVNLVATPASGYRFVIWTGDVETIGNVNAAETTITMDGSYSITASFEEHSTGESVPMVAAGENHTVGLRSDGTVLAVGLNHDGQCDVGGWTHIVQVATGYYHTVGLRSDRTVVAVGYNEYGQCDVGSWTDIVQVTAGEHHTVGLKADGTVVTVGRNHFDQRNTGSWTNIVQVAAGYFHTVGVKSDGTVVAVGWNNYGQCDVGAWTGIVQVAASGRHTVGLKSDGTVVAVGWNDYGQCHVGGWANIVQVAAGRHHTVGVKSDGTVVAVGRSDYGQCDVGGWTGIVQVAAPYYHTVGLKADGTVVAVGFNDHGQCDVGGWNLL